MYLMRPRRVKRPRRGQEELLPLLREVTKCAHCPDTCYKLKWSMLDKCKRFLKALPQRLAI